MTIAECCTRSVNVLIIDSHSRDHKPQTDIAGVARPARRTKGVTGWWIYPIDGYSDAFDLRQEFPPGARAELQDRAAAVPLGVAYADNGAQGVAAAGAGVTRLRPRGQFDAAIAIPAVTGLAPSSKCVVAHRAFPYPQPVPLVERFGSPGP